MVFSLSLVKSAGHEIVARWGVKLACNVRLKRTSLPVMTDSVASDKTRGLSLLRPEKFFRPRPKSELDAAAIEVQKVYRSYRSRRNLADCADVVEELQWKAIDFAAVKHSSISFYENAKPETFDSRWARTTTRVAEVVKALPKDEKAQKPALPHWLEAIGPRHCYGHNLHLYYDVWFKSDSTLPFFYRTKEKPKTLFLFKRGAILRGTGM